MKKKEILNLKKGDVIGHRHFRKVIVNKVLFATKDIFGVIIVPCYYKDRLYLSSKTGMHFNTPFLESSLRLLKSI